MNKSKRKLVKFGLGTWFAPTVLSISIPAHAQTSQCQISDVIGDWSLSIGTNGEARIFTLIADESGVFEGEPFTWSVSDNTLFLESLPGTLIGLVIEMDLSMGCRMASGRIIDNAGDGASESISGELNE